MLTVGTRASDFRLEQSTGFLVNRVASAMKLSLEQKLSAHGVTSKQFALLTVLLKDEPHAPSDLSQRFDVELSAVSRLVDRLVDKQLVTRRVNAADRRAQHLVLSAKGRALARELGPLARQVLTQFHAGFSQKELATLHGYLRRLLANAK